MAVATGGFATRAVGAALLLACGVVLSFPHADRTVDSFCFLSATRLFVQRESPYAEDVWSGATGGYYSDRHGSPAHSSCEARWAYPLTTAVLLAPFGLLPLELASPLWMATDIAGAVAGIVLMWRSVGGARGLGLVFAIAVIFSQPFLLMLMGGQPSGMGLALVGLLCRSLRAQASVGTGLTLVALAFKPQVWALPMIVMIASDLRAHRTRTLMAAVGAGSLVALVSLLVLPEWPLQWVEGILNARVALIPVLPTAWGLAHDVLGDTAFGFPLVAAVSGAVAVLIRPLRLEAITGLALAIPLSLFVSPHVWSYDFLVLALPWAMLLSLTSRLTGSPRFVALVVFIGLSSVLPWLLFVWGNARGQETTSALIPALTALALAVMLRTARSIPHAI